MSVSDRISPRAVRQRRKRIKESDVEQYLRQQVKLHGGEAWKFKSPGHVGVPDRIVFLPCACGSLPQPLFVECKAPGRKLTPKQADVAAELHELGATAVMVDTCDAVDRLLAYWCDGSCARALVT